MKTLKEMNKDTELYESISNLNKAFIKFKSIYQGGKRYNAKEWIQLMSDILDTID